MLSKVFLGIFVSLLAALSQRLEIGGKLWAESELPIFQHPGQTEEDALFQLWLGNTVKHKTWNKRKELTFTLERTEKSQ